MKLNALRPNPSSRHPEKRLGRGDGSGHGGTSTRGHKGQKARAGGFHKLGFEGGQMPLQRRLPKRGFTNVFRRPPAIVNLDQLGGFAAGGEVSLKTLQAAGLVRAREEAVKLLGRGEVTKALLIHGLALSGSARKKIEAAGGKVNGGKTE